MKKKLLLGLSIFIIILLGFATYIMLAGSIALSKNETFYIFGYGYGAVPTQSMEVPGDQESLKAGDMVLFYKTDFSSLIIGDIIIFKQYEQTIDQEILKVHRIISIDYVNQTLVTQGDANAVPDEPIDASQYRARIVSKFTFFNLGQIIVTHRNSFFGIVILLGSIFIIVEIIDIVKQINGRNKAKLLKAHEEELEAKKKQLYDEILAEESKKNKA